MARDYKSRAQGRPKKQPTPLWVWLLVGYLLGLFSAGLVWLKFAPNDQRPQWIGSRPGVEKPATAAKPAVDKPKADTPRFDFYTLLPEMEVVIPDDELDQDAAPPPGKKTADDGASYLLQVGSFTKPADAERLKAELALLGFQARVNAIKASDRTWHRVRIGPFAAPAALREAQQQLAQNGHRSFVIKIR